MSIRVRIAEARRFIVDCLKAAGANETPAMQQAELFIQADRMGHQSHGLNRLESCVNDITNKVCEPNNEPEIIKESRSTAWIDARNCLGATSSQLGMDLAVTKAKDTGIGWVSVKGSNHNGMLGYWAKLAAKKGFIGLAFANSAPLVAPTRSKKAALGTNPLAVVAPAGDDEFFFLEMATSAVTLGVIEMRRKVHMYIPDGWALGLDGRATTDPEEAMRTSVLMPLGGGETTSGYKGYGLCAAVELLTGMCAGSNYAHHIQPLGASTADNPANLGQTFICVNPNSFAPGFHTRLLECMQYWRQLEPVDAEKPVIAPGDIEKMAAEATDARNAILYLPYQISICAALAEKLNVKHIETIVDKE
ncbi:unnamed protein product [Arctia plantaginis]|uniref:Malate dehydrogenase n=1 Tax=Arctia plantaginis TaxID=874455 RepID=A0A8S1AXY6_ARCPL|nr:unnamed protein product [Arctia plantaginis]